MTVGGDIGGPRRSYGRADAVPRGGSGFSTPGISRRTAITGIGQTAYTKNSGKSVLHLASEACARAIQDAGVDPLLVDGIVTFGINDTVFPRAVGTELGLTQLGFQQYMFGGGDVCVFSIGLAAMGITSGMARHVLVFRALNGRSGHRLGGTGDEEAFRFAHDEEQYMFPSGLTAPAHRVALAARRHMIKYGTTSRDYAAVAVTFRENALINDDALMRSPLTIEDHQNSRMIVDPLRLFDICQENDGGCAVLVSGADEARSLRHEPVYVLAAGQASRPRPGRGYEFYTTEDDLADDFSGILAPQLWSQACLGPDEIDVVSLYDCFTPAVISQLEGFGFAPRGQGGPFASEGRIRRDGDIPVNTGGGMLSEAYIHGLNGVLELVKQLRGHAGARQITDAATGLASGFATTTGCAVVIGK